MIAIVLAAGYATRLYPLTENFPKPLLPVNEKPILNWLLDDLEEQEEITGYVIVSNHKFIGYFEGWKETLNYKKPVILVDDGSTDNEHRLGAVKDIQVALEAIKGRSGESFLVIAGDNLLDFSFREFIQFSQKKQAPCVMCHEENDLKRQQKTAIIVKDVEDKIISYEEKPEVPKGNLAVPPFYCYREEDVARIDEAIKAGCSIDAPGSFAAWLSYQTDVYAWTMSGKRHDIGDRASYDAVQEIMKNQA